MKIDQHQLLRFSTVGNVDDGKSTLIGRLLYDSKSLFEDQIESVKKYAMKKSGKEIDFSMFTDGLQDEREQGITIDVAYRYFTTPSRKFIIADTPGHLEYTRNMVTGASTANAVVVLIDARKGVVEQTKRHSFITSLLQIPHLLICINKMDLVDYSEEKFYEIKSEFEKIASKLLINDIRFIPISALKGDNVVNRSENMSWYNGATFLDTLENLHIGSDYNKVDARLPIQTVVHHSTENENFRGYAGRIASGIFRKGEEVVVLPSGFSSTIKQINCAGKEIEEAFPPMSVMISLNDELDVSRGNMLVKKNNQPQLKQEFDMMLCWLDQEAAQNRKKYSILHANNEAQAMIKEVIYKIDGKTLLRNSSEKDLKMNDIARVKIRTSKTLFIDPYRTNRITGSVILIDENTKNTVAAGMII